MWLHDSQRRSPHLSKNRCQINISIVALEYERNIQPTSQCYAGACSYFKLLYNPKQFLDFLPIAMLRIQFHFSEHMQLYTTINLLSLLNFSFLCIKTAINSLSLFNFDFLRIKTAVNLLCLFNFSFLSIKTAINLLSLFNFSFLSIKTATNLQQSVQFFFSEYKNCN